MTACDEMLRDGSSVGGEGEQAWDAPSATRAGEDWREVDHALRGITKRRAALDAEEARWLCKAARIRIWREVGCISMSEYMERRMGCEPRTAKDRRRVARCPDPRGLEAVRARLHVAGRSAILEASRSVRDAGLVERACSPSWLARSTSSRGGEAESGCHADCPPSLTAASDVRTADESRVEP